MKRSLRAQKAALRVLQENNVTSLPIPMRQIAGKHAHVFQEVMEDDISGMLIPLSPPRNQKEWAIVVNQDHSQARQRFTLAHELGHILLHGYTTPHADRGYKLRYRNSASATGSVLEEVEANQFAAELLMPEHLLLQKLERESLEYVPVGDDEDDPRLTKLARELKVSRQALAIRLSNLLI
jgi:Zn-dependent peptidase ImmA (M78 family)